MRVAVGAASQLIVANHARYNRQFMGEGFNPVQLGVWDAGADALGEAALFWGEGERAFLLPFKPRGDFLRDLTHCGEESLGTFDEVEQALERFTLASRVKLLPWGAEPGLARLAQALENLGIEVDSDDLLDSKIQVELEGKADFRTSAQGHPIPFPEGFVANSPGRIMELVAIFKRRGKGAVVKANHGAGGYTVKIFTPSELCDLGRVQSEIDLRIRWDGFWKSPPYVVEEYVEAGIAGQLALTTDWLLSSDGTATEMGTGKMCISSRSIYEGVTAGDDVLGGELAAKARLIGRKVARFLFAKGYYGWFDVDLVADERLNLYVTEVNLRRTSPAHGFYLAKNRWGANWSNKGVVCCRDSLAVKYGMDYKDVKAKVDTANRDLELDGAQITVTSATSGLGGKIPTIGVAITAESALSAKVALAHFTRLVGPAPC